MNTEFTYDDINTAVSALVILTFAFCAYFLPLIVASVRSHRQIQAICVVNLFLGWTLLGWVIALAWAFTADVRQPKLNINLRGE